eukprot:5295564-Alexandrium_andersonii.AAC.1
MLPSLDDTNVAGTPPSVDDAPPSAPQMSPDQVGDAGDVDVVDDPDRLEPAEFPVLGPPVQVGGSSSSGGGQGVPPAVPAGEPVATPPGDVAPGDPGPDLARAEIERNIPCVDERGKGEIANGEYQGPVAGTQRVPGTPSKLWNSYPPKIRDGPGQ